MPKHFRLVLLAAVASLAHGLERWSPEWWFGQPGMREATERACAARGARDKPLCRLFSRVRATGSAVPRRLAESGSSAGSGTGPTMLSVVAHRDAESVIALTNGGGSADKRGSIRLNPKGEVEVTH